MESSRFDRLARIIADLTSRRAVVRGITLGGVTAALGLGLADADDAEARKKQNRQRARRKRARSEKKKKTICHCTTNDPATCSTIKVKKKQRNLHLKHHCDYAGECIAGKAGECAPPITGCTRDSDCTGNTRFCQNRVCVQCRNDQGCAAGQICVAGACATGCTRDSDCSGATPFCQNQICVACRNNGDCDETFVCTNNTCGCPSGLVVCDEICRAIDGDACSANAGCCSGACTCGTGPTAGLCQGDFFQGFEENTDGWANGITRVASNTDGIPARTGGFYAQVAQNGSSSTRWGGYSNVFPQGGYTTETAIYIDIENAPVVDTRFDYSSAINRPDCEHRRDFVFNAGVNLVAAVPTYCVSASNDGNGWPCNPGRDPKVLTESGWYLFRHTFRAAAGDVLAVDLILIDPSGNEVNTWTLSDPTDIIDDTVGGNRYGWFVRNQFAFLGIDDTSRE